MGKRYTDVDDRRPSRHLLEHCDDLAAPPSLVAYDHDDREGFGLGDNGPDEPVSSHVMKSKDAAGYRQKAQTGKSTFAKRTQSDRNIITLDSERSGRILSLG
jgi:hypothetical protein